MFFFGREAHFPTVCSNWTGIVKSHYGLLGLIAPNHCSARAVLIAFNGICQRGRPSLLLPANPGSYFLVSRSPDYFILGDIQFSKTNLRTGLVVDHHMWLFPMVANQRCDVCDVFRLEICQKIYTTGFSGQKFYTLKVRKLWPFLLTMKQCKCIKIGKLSKFF